MSESTVEISHRSTSRCGGVPRQQAMLKQLTDAAAEADAARVAAEEKAKELRERAISKDKRIQTAILEKAEAQSQLKVSQPCPLPNKGWPASCENSCSHRAVYFRAATSGGALSTAATQTYS